MSAENNVILIGRMVKDADLRYTQGENSVAVASFTVAVNRSRHAEGQPNADFISCSAFGKTAENIEKFFKKGNRIALQGHIQTGSYTNKDGNKVYTTTVIADSFAFVESKSERQQETATAESPAEQIQNKVNMPTGVEDFMSIPDSIGEELPFK